MNHQPISSGFDDFHPVLNGMNIDEFHLHMEILQV